MNMRERASKAWGVLAGKPLAPPQAVPAVPPRNDWNWPTTIREPFTGAWQRNQELPASSLQANPTVFACITLIAGDIAKLAPVLLRDSGGGLWQPTTNPAYSPVLRAPNHYQNHIQFKENWIVSKLSQGNTFVLKQRDLRGVVSALYILDPKAVTPMVTPSGDIWYQLRADNLSGLKETDELLVPASEVIHDRFNTLFHPLIGLSPLFAAALPAISALSIGNSASNFWGNAARPSGILTAPGAIGDDTAKRLRDYWQDNFTGAKAGRVAVLGDGLKFEPMTMTAVDAQLVEQLKWTAETICSVFHVPAFKVGVGAMPTYQNGETLNGIYYSDCLQALIESWEQCIDDGLELANDLAVELDLRQLLRMDTASRYKAHSDAIGAGWMTPNEARRAEDLPPLEGGDTAYMQQQNYSLAALAARERAP